MPRPGYYVSIGDALPGAAFGGAGLVTAGADVACPSATDTVILSTTATVNDDGPYIWNWAGLAAIVLGATPPTGLIFKVTQTPATRFTGVSSMTVPPVLLVASATLSVGFDASQNDNSANVLSRGTFTINLTLNPTGQAVTLKAGSCANLTAYRIQD